MFHAMSSSCILRHISCSSACGTAAGQRSIRFTFASARVHQVQHRCLVATAAKGHHEPHACSAGQSSTGAGSAEGNSPLLPLGLGEDHEQFSHAQMCRAHNGIARHSEASQAPSNLPADDEEASGQAISAAAASSVSAVRDAVNSLTAKLNSVALNAPLPSRSAAVVAIPLWERMVAAAVFVLPVSEGLLRLSAALMSHLHHTALDLVVWAQVQATYLHALLLSAPAHGAATLAHDVSVYQSLGVWAQRVLLRAEEVQAQLTGWTQPLLVPGQGAATMPGVRHPVWPELLSLDGLWTAAWLTATIGILAWATSAAAQASSSPVGSAGVQAAAIQPPTAQGKGSSTIALPHVQRPQLLAASALCALLLCCCWAPAVPHCDVALVRELYHPAAVILTTSTTAVATLTMGQALAAGATAAAPGSGYGSAAHRARYSKQQLVNMLGLAHSVVAWHRALVTFDVTTTLCLGSCGVEFKFLLAAAYLAYSLGLDWLTARADALVSGSSTGKGGPGGAGGQPLQLPGRSKAVVKGRPSVSRP